MEKGRHCWGLFYPCPSLRRRVSPAAIVDTVAPARPRRADEPVRVGVNDRLLDGAHRVACALALRLPEIWQIEDPREARRTWGIDWFAAHGLDADEQHDLLQRFARILACFGRGAVGV